VESHDHVENLGSQVCKTLGVPPTGVVVECVRFEIPVCVDLEEQIDVVDLGQRRQHGIGIHGLKAKRVVITGA
jgi:hypothetical protein